MSFYIFLSGACSYYLYQRNGRFTSPSFPYRYSNNQHCTWSIEAPYGYYINLQFGSFNLESGYDWVEIFDGSSAYSTRIKKGKAAISHLGECVAVEGFFLWSSQQIQVLRVKAFQLLTGLYHVVKKHLSAYPFIFDKTYFFIRKKWVSAWFILINEKIYSKIENFKCSSKVHVCHHFSNFDCMIMVYATGLSSLIPPSQGPHPKRTAEKLVNLLKITMSLLDRLRVNKSYTLS